MERNVPIRNDDFMEKRKNSSFFHVAMIVAILCVIIIAVVLSVLWSALEKYEKGTPESAIQLFLSYAMSGDSKTLMESVGISETEFFKAKDYQQYMHAQLGNNIEEIQVLELENGQEGTKYLLSKKGSQGIEITLSKKSEEQGSFNEYNISQKVPPQSDCVIIAPGDFEIYVNDILLEERHQIQEISVSQFETVENADLVPKVKTYQINGLLNFPKITVKGKEASEYQAKREKNTVIINGYPKEDNQIKIKQIAETASIAYAKFISQDGQFQEYTQYVDKTSSYYKAIRNFDNSWYIPHDSVAVENMQMSDMIAYSEQCFSVDVQFDYVVIKGRIRRIYDTHYKLYFLLQNNQYQIVNLELK